MNYYLKAFQKARQAKGFTSPNPAVGAVLVKNNQIIGLGSTSEYGGPHAEIHAINRAGKKSVGSTLYVTLEPCCTHGNTPPCTEAIIAHHIKKVIIGTPDPNPAVYKKSSALLKKKGIQVEYSFPEKITGKLIELNEDFFCAMKYNKPFISVKYAMTLDGKIAADSGCSKWISSEKSRKYVHYLRQINDAIVVGAGTVLADNPSLTTRYYAGKNSHPVRVITDKNGETPKNANVMTSSVKTIFIISKRANKSFRSSVIQSNKEFKEFSLRNEMFDLTKVFHYLYTKYNLQSFLIEGGARLMGSALEQDCIDKAYVFIAPTILGGKALFSPFITMSKTKSISEARLLLKQKVIRFDTNIMVKGYFKNDL